MILRLLVDVPAASGRAVEVSCAGGATIDEVVAALATHFGLAGRWQLHRVLDDLTLTSSDAVAVSRLCDGDHVALMPGRWSRAASGTVDELELVVLGGSANGQSVPLTEGAQVIGRAPPQAPGIGLDSPFVSADHARLVVGDVIVVADNGSRNGTTVRHERLAAGVPATVAIGETFTVADLLVTIERPRPATPSPRVVDGKVSFNRPPRTPRPEPVIALEAPTPPDEPTKPTFRFSYATAPVVLGIVMFFALGQNPAFLAFMLLSPVVMVASYVEDGRTGRRAFRQKSEAFLATVDERAVQLRTAIDAEQSWMRTEHPHGAELCRWIAEGDRRLWERRATDSDFLTLRFGWGDVPSWSRCVVPPRGDEHLRAQAEAMLAAATTRPDSPLVADLRRFGSWGISGRDNSVSALGRWLVLQLAVHHSPDELVLAAVVPHVAPAGDAWAALAWLPHADSAQLGSSVVDETDARLLLQRLDLLIEERETKLGTRGGAVTSPAVVLVVHHSSDLERSAMAQLMMRGPAVGVHVIWMGDEMARLPSNCGAVIDIAAGGVVTWHARDTPPAFGFADGMPAGLADTALRALARYRDVAGRGAGGRVPDSADLLDLLDQPEPTAAHIAERWEANEGTLIAPIGITADGPFVLDLGEAADGPHGVIGGSPGSGKSILLQSLLLSYAATHSPAELNMLIIDWKGEGAAAFCRRLPHSAGTVTSLDGSLERAIAMLEAEWHRRDALFNRYPGVDKLEKLWAIDPTVAPPYLLIVVDEFAEVQRLFPELFKSFASLAALGRSRGARLLLATQRPGAAVGSELGNIDLRIALRMNEPSDSKAVIDVDAAARLSKDRPGRAFAKSGRRRLTEFQTAFIDDRPRERVSVQVRSLDGEPRQLPPAGPVAPGDSPLDRLVLACVEAWSDRAPVHHVFAEALPELLPFRAALDAAPPGAGPLLGLFDIPELQRQEIRRHEPDTAGALLVYGGGGSGKTTTLRTLAAGWALSSSPDEVHIYGIDAGTRGLDGLRDLPHTGDVINVGDDERVVRLFRLVRDEVAARKEIFATHRVSTYTEYREHVGALPRIVVLVDGLAAFLHAYESAQHAQLVDALPGLIQDGRSLGLNWVITVEQPLAARSGITAAAGSSLVLRHSSPAAYPASFDTRKASTPLPPGRGFANGRDLVQVAIVGNDPSGPGQRAALESLGRWAVMRWPGLRAPPIGTLPSDMRIDEIPVAATGLQAAIGLYDSDLSPCVIDLVDGPLLIVGSRRSGRSTSLRTVADGLRRAGPGLELVLISPPQRSATGNAPGPYTAVLTIQDHIESFVQDMRARLDRGGPAAHVVVLVDDAEEFNEGGCAACLQDIVKRGAEVGVHVVAAADTRAAMRAYGGFLPEIARRRHGIVLQPDGPADGDLLGLTLPRSMGRMVPGRGVFGRRGDAQIVQVARS